VLRAQLGDSIQVSSAGLSGLEGYPADPDALALMAEHGIDGSSHVARKLTVGMLYEADLVLGMEASHVAAMAKLAPEARGKLYLFDHWTGKRDIPDPYRQRREAFEHVYRRIDEAAKGWGPYLK
jgi:protein-tyrosine phosphatase